ncbi:MAG TPA: S1C family serine protease [Ideonella sp.]|uniref:S1C family serine protease n=1 Tax=Ideonella sp. TaxID=1929293 RepID=UPI002E302AEE|nr:S1C family serine protease [Ideonella sp.]HEX5682686.1 S1C family serine protease [Ideonella sp.]
MTLRLFLIAMSMSAMAKAASVPPVPKAPENASIKIAAGQTPQTIQVKSVFMSPTNEPIGVWLSGLWCGSSDRIFFTDKFASARLQDFGLIVRRELEAAGYPKFRESAFQSSLPSAAAEYELAATLTDVSMNVCGKYSELEGGMWMRLSWELFSPRERRVVYSTVTEGAMRTAASKVDADELTKGAIAAAVKNLLADPSFVEQATRRAQFASASADQPVLRILRRSNSSAKTADLVPQMQSAVATLFSGAASGSGFFVDPAGYLLTNQHVVGDAKFVKVKLASGKEMLGEVVRSAALRDVALVKTDPVSLAVFDLATATPNVGVEVLALGSPLGDANSSSVTRGVLSAVREVEHLRWLQSDVRILPGSSGGPLVGPSGSVIGIAASGIAGGIAGINYFVPIEDAVSALRLGFVGE